MKTLQTFFLSAATTVLLAACNGTTPPVVIEQTTFDLGITVTGVAGAPVKVLNAAGEIKFDATVTGSKTLSALPKGKYTVTGGAVANFTAPAVQTADLSAGNGAVTLGYVAAAGQALILDKIQGTLSDPQAPGNTLNVFFGDSVLASSKVGADGSVSLPLTAPPPASLTPFLPPAGSSCSYTGVPNTGKVFVTDNVILNGSQGDAIGAVTERPVGASSTASVLHAYADIAQNNQGTIACFGSAPVKVDVRLSPGWNVLIIDKDAGGTITVVTAPPETRVQLKLDRFPANVGIVLDTPSVTLKAGESVTVNATIFQRGGLSGKIDLSTDVPGVTVDPASVTLPVLGTQSVDGQSLLDSVVFTQRGFLPLNVGVQRVNTVLTFKASADAKGFTGAMTLLAKQNGQAVGQTNVGLSLTASAVSVNFQNNQLVISLAPGESTTVPVTVNSIFGFAGTVTVSMSGLPSGVSVTPRVVQVTTATSTTVNLTVSAASSAAPGSTTVKVVTDATNETPSVFGTNQAELRIVPARTRLPGGASAIFPAANGVWLVNNSGQTVTRYVNGVAQNSLTLDPSFGLLGSLKGDLYAVRSNPADGTVRTIHDDGSYQDVSTDISIGNAAGNRTSVVDANGNIWYIDIRVIGVGGLEKRLIRYNTSGTVNTIPGVNPDFMSNGLNISNNGKILVIKSGTSSLFSKIVAATGTVSPINATVQGITQVVVGNEGVLWWAGLNGGLQRLNTDESITSFSGVAVTALIGFDRQNPDVLWMYSYGRVSRLTLSNLKMTDIYFQSSNGGTYSLSSTGGLDLIYDMNGSDFYLSHVN